MKTRRQPAAKLPRPLLAALCAAVVFLPTTRAASVTASGEVTPTPVPNPRTTNWDVGGPLIVGDTGTGTLTLADYINVSSTVTRIGNQAGSNGTVAVNSSSTWYSTSDLLIGHAGTGKMVVNGSSTVITVDTSIADLAGSTGTVEINGWGAEWENSGDFFVGRGGTASLTVGFIASLETQTLYTAMDSLHGVGDIYAKGVVLDFSAPGEKLVFDSTHGTDQTLAFGTSGNLYLDINGTGALGAGFRGAGEIQIKEGVKVSSSAGYLGMMAGSVGTGTVTGAGSEWNISQGLYAGQEGRATLFIGNGGKVSSAWGTIDAGEGASSSSVYVLGAGSVWSNTNQLVVGEKGLANLQVTTGGLVESGSGVIGNLATSTGTVTVSGTNSAWNVAGSLYVGKEGTGSLTVSDGGSVTAQTLYTDMANLHGNGSISAKGLVFDATQEIVIDGTDSNTFGTGGALHLDLDGTGIFGVGYKNFASARILNGAVVRSTEGYLGLTAGSGGSVSLTGTNTAWIVSGNLHVGNNVNGGYSDLTILNGAKVSAASVSINSQYSNIPSIVSLQDAASVWTNSGTLTVGESGHGAFQVNGGTATSGNTVLGKNANSSGKAIIRVATGHWNINGSLTVGEAGKGTLSVQSGSRVESDSVVIGSAATGTGTATITNANSTLALTGNLAVGEDGTGTLTVSAGGSVSNVNGYVGANAGSTGTALVTGVGSTWTNTGALHVGENGTGSLTVSAGGSVHTTGALTLYGAGDSLALAGGTVTADGGVYVLAGATLGGTGIINGDLDFASGAKFTFDLSKTLIVNGTVSMDSSFGIASLLGLDASTAEGSYTLIATTATDFSVLGLQNWGYANRYRLSADGDPYKAAYFSQGSLVVTVVPEPAATALLLGLFATGTLLCQRRVRITLA